MGMSLHHCLRGIHQIFLRGIHQIFLIVAREVTSTSTIWMNKDNFFNHILDKLNDLEINLQNEKISVY